MKSFLSYLREENDAPLSSPPVAPKKNPYWYKGANRTVDLVTTRTHPTQGRQMLLIKRAKGAVEGGKWALPGGFVNTSTAKGEEWKDEHNTETPKEAAMREAGEETGIKMTAKEHGGLLRPVGTYEGSGRDPRDNPESWSRSHAFAIHVPHAEDDVRGSDDADEAAWHSTGKLPELAFDHAKIIRDSELALSRMRKRFKKRA